jgi:ankyrin repeat protein
MAMRFARTVCMPLAALASLVLAQAPEEPAAVDLVLRAIDAGPGRLEAEIRKGVNLNARSSRGDTVWCYALTFGRPDRIELLLENGADPNFEFRPPCRINAGGRPVHLAVIFSKPEVLKVLIKHGVDVNAKDGAGLTALHYVVLGRGPELARLLLEAGADLNAKGPHGETPVNQAKWARERGIANPETAQLINEAASKAR